ncbi:MAG TPA: HEAT repeat domain-containing protein [Myxococcaceae bacterium]
MSSSDTVPTALRSLALAVLLLAPLALAGSPTTQKRIRARDEVVALLEQLAKGGPVQSTISRLKLTGEREYAATSIQEFLQEIVDERTRRNFVAVLASLEVRSAEQSLEKLAADPDSAVRMYAAQGLGRIKSRKVDVLLPLLEDKSSGVRKESARALGAAGKPEVGKDLVAAAKKETDVEVRAEMLAAAGKSGDAKQAPALKEFLNSDSESTRFAAAKGLCNLGAPEGYTFANKLLGAEDRFVRRQGLALYEGVAAKKAEPALRPLLEDKDRGIAASAARILYQGGDKKMLDWLVVSSWNAKSATEKDSYEKELEQLLLADDERKSILRKAGLVK